MTATLLGIAVLVGVTRKLPEVFTFRLVHRSLRSESVLYIRFSKVRKPVARRSGPCASVGNGRSPRPRKP